MRWQNILVSAKRPLALAGGMGVQPTAAAVAANLLNTLIPGSADLIDLEAQAASLR